MMPVLLVLDGGLQEDPISPEVKERLRIPKLTLASPPQGDSGAVAEAARLLVAAQNPVIIADRAARTPAGMAHLVELAELLQAPVIDQGGRMNFPTRHPLNQTSAGGRQLLGNADVILGLELTDFWGTVDSFRDSLVRSSKSLTSRARKLIRHHRGDLYTKGNYQDFQRYPEVDIAMAADAEATLPALIEAAKKAITGDRRRVSTNAGRHSPRRMPNALDRARARRDLRLGREPDQHRATDRRTLAQIKNDDWAVVSESGNTSGWSRRLWDYTKPYQWIGSSGPVRGVGYGAARQQWAPHLRTRSTVGFR